MPETEAESLYRRPVLVRVSEPLSSTTECIELVSNAGDSTSGPVLVSVARNSNHPALVSRSNPGATPVSRRASVAHAVLPESWWHDISQPRLFILSAAGLAVAAGVAGVFGITVLRQEKAFVPSSQYTSAAEYSIPSLPLVSPQIVPAANDGAEAKATNPTAGAQDGITVSNVPIAAAPQLLDTPGDPRHLLASPVMDSSLDVTPPSLPVAAPEHSADFVPSTVLFADLSQPKLDVTPSRPVPSSESDAKSEPVLATAQTTQGSDKDAVLAALQKYSRAWSDKDIADILALRPHLGRRTVKQELADVRSIAMRIRPVGAPKIEGDQAAVVCIHEVSETFGDGIARQIPGTRMTYFLARGSAGTWQISDSR